MGPSPCDCRALSRRAPGPAGTRPRPCRSRAAAARNNCRRRMEAGCAIARAAGSPAPGPPEIGARARHITALQQADALMPAGELGHSSHLIAVSDGPHQRARSLAGEAPRRSKQTFGLSHQVVEMDAFSEQIGRACRASRSSASVSSMAPAGLPPSHLRSSRVWGAASSKPAAGARMSTGDSLRAEMLCVICPHFDSGQSQAMTTASSRINGRHRRTRTIGDTARAARRRSTLILLSRGEPTRPMALASHRRVCEMTHIDPVDVDTFYSSPSLEVWRRVLGDRMHYHHGIWEGDENWASALDNAVLTLARRVDRAPPCSTWDAGGVGPPQCWPSGWAATWSVSRSVGPRPGTAPPAALTFATWTSTATCPTDAGRSGGGWNRWSTSRTRSGP